MWVVVDGHLVIIPGWPPVKWGSLTYFDFYLFTMVNFVKSSQNLLRGGKFNDLNKVLI